MHHSAYMTDLVLQSPAASKDDPFQLSLEITQLKTLLDERRAELAALQDELREFRARYTDVVGSRLAELAEIERAIKEMEARVTKNDAGDEEPEASELFEREANASAFPPEQSLRKLFWSIAKLFHPDRAADEREAERRHQIMAEASRAYTEGDAERLTLMLGDDDLQFYCATARLADDADDLAARLMSLKEELRTLEFGIKRTRQDGLYKLKLAVDEDATRGRDMLTEMAARIRKQIVQTRYRLEQID